MRNNKKNSINWLCNQSEVGPLIKALGARNITVVESCILHSENKEEVLDSYDKMVMDNEPEARYKLIEWTAKQPMRHDDKYVYFRVKRWN